MALRADAASSASFARARQSGLSENSSVAHDHKSLCMALHLGHHYDQYNLANSAMAEQIVRRLIQHEMAVERSAFMQKLRKGVGFMVNRKLALGFAGWRHSNEVQRGRAASAGRMARALHHLDR